MKELIDRTYSYLSSMKTGIILLVAIGVTSAIGASFMPSYFYDSFVFKFLLLLLLHNMMFCTINQLRNYLKRSKSKEKRTIVFKRVGIVTLHAGIVLILIGGTVNAFDGQYENVHIHEGDTFNISSIIPKAKPFELRVDKFEIEFNEDESVSQYVSRVTLFEEGNAVQESDISVNHPLIYGGIKAYQSNYGYLVDLEGHSDSGWSERKLLHQGDVLEIKDSDKVLLLYKYIPNFDHNYGMQSKSLKPDNPIAVFSIYENGVMADVGFAPLGESVEIVPGIYVKFNGVKPYTGLIIKRDPGLPLAAAGGLMLMAGSCLALILRGRKQGDE